MPRFFDYGSHCKTGGVASRDAVWYLSFASGADWSDITRATDMGGPIDAPETMPSGCCNSVTWHDGAYRADERRFHGATSTVRRG